jgi:hypothetical protein
MPVNKSAKRVQVKIEFVINAVLALIEVILEVVENATRVEILGNTECRVQSDSGCATMRTDGELGGVCVASGYE